MFTQDPDRTAVAPAGLDRRASFLLVQLGTHRHRRFAERLASADFHPRHFGMLHHIAAHEGQSQQALSSALGIHRSAMVALVDELEGRGLVERRRDPGDRRAYTLFLTASGQRALAELQSVADADEEELLHALDVSERAQLISLMQRIAASQGLVRGVHPQLEPGRASDQSVGADDQT